MKVGKEILILLGSPRGNGCRWAEDSTALTQACTSHSISPFLVSPSSSIRGGGGIRGFPVVYL